MNNLDKKNIVNYLNDQLDTISVSEANGYNADYNRAMLKGCFNMLECLGYEAIVKEDKVSAICHL